MVEYAKAGMLKDITSFVQSDLSPIIGKGAWKCTGSGAKFYGAPTIWAPWDFGITKKPSQKPA